MNDEITLSICLGVLISEMIRIRKACTCSILVVRDHKKGIALVFTRMTIIPQVISSLAKIASSQIVTFVTPFAANSPMVYMHKNVELLNSKPSPSNCQVKSRSLPCCARAKFVQLQSLSWNENEENHETGINKNRDS